MMDEVVAGHTLCSFFPRQLPSIEKIRFVCSEVPEQGPNVLIPDLPSRCIWVVSDHQYNSAVSRKQGFADRKSTRLNSSHGYISYAVFCLKKKTTSRGSHATATSRLH